MKIIKNTLKNKIENTTKRINNVSNNIQKNTYKQNTVKKYEESEIGKKMVLLLTIMIFCMIGTLVLIIV